MKQNEITNDAPVTGRKGLKAFLFRKFDESETSFVDLLMITLGGGFSGFILHKTFSPDGVMGLTTILAMLVASGLFFALKHYRVFANEHLITFAGGLIIGSSLYETLLNSIVFSESGVNILTGIIITIVLIIPVFLVKNISEKYQNTIVFTSITFAGYLIYKILSAPTINAVGIVGLLLLISLVVLTKFKVIPGAIVMGFIMGDLLGFLLIPGFVTFTKMHPIVTLVMGLAIFLALIMIRTFSANVSFKVGTVLLAVFIFVIMAGIFISLVYESDMSLKKFGISFLWKNAWNPVTGEFGALTSIFGTLLSTLLAMFIAVPLSLIIALFLVELAPPSISKPVGGAIELLAAIPSIIFGMWGLFVFAPYMAEHVQPFLTNVFGDIPLLKTLFTGPPIGIGMLTAGIILALMILPFVSAVMRDVFAMVPAVVKESAYGMGSTTWEVTRKVTMKYGIKGLVGASFLGLGRAIGETMAVTFVIGNSHTIDLSLFTTSNTIASTLANEFAEASEDLYLSALMHLGLVLFVMTIIVQIIAQLWVRKINKSMGGGL